MTGPVAGPRGKIAIDDGGSGEPVVFVHSLAGHKGHWDRQLAEVRRTRRGVALDLRAHGGSDAPKDGQYAIDALAAAVAAVADALALERFSLIGHSFGAGVALAYAGARPERITHLLLADPIGDGTRTPEAEVRPFLDALESPAYVETIEGYWTSIAGQDSAVRERLLNDLRATPREAVINGLHATMAFDPKPALARYRGATLAVITPANDFPYSLHRVGAGLAHHVIEGTGHWLQIEAPGEFNQVMERFLTQ